MVEQEEERREQEERMHGKVGCSRQGKQKGDTGSVTGPGHGGEDA